MKIFRANFFARSLLLVAGLALSLSFTVITAGAGFTLQQAMSFAFPDNLVAAAHGERVAWVFNIKGVRNIWIADGPQFVARQITHYSEDDGRPIASLRITPDGQTLVYARGSETNHAGEVADPTSDVQTPHQQVWAVDVGNSQPRLLGTMECGEEGCEDIEISPDGQWAVWPARHQLWIAPVSGAEPAKALAYVRGDNIQPQWSPDSRQVAFVSSRGDHSFIVVYDFGRSTLQYLAPSVDRDFMPRWSRDGKQIIFIRTPGQERGLPMIPVRPQPWSIWKADPSTGQGQQVWHSSSDENRSLPHFLTLEFAAENRIVFISEQDGWSHLYSVPATGGTATPLTTGEFDVEQVTLSRDGKSVVYTSNQDDIDRRHIWKVGIEGGAPAAVTRGEAIEWSPVETGDGKNWVCLGSAATSPAMPYHITAQGRTMIASAALAPDYPSAEMVAPRQVIFKSEDGFTIHGQIFVPKGRTAAGPALVYIHGGSRRQMLLGFHYMDYYHYAYAENQYLADLGYVVLSVNYRTGVMYGRAFREPAHAGWRGASEYNDIVAAGKYLQDLPIVDPRKIGLWGGSYGGFLTAMGLARNSDIFAAGVDMHGVHDWRVELAFWSRTSGAPDLAAAEKLAFESSPIASISTWKSPVLLIQGDDDRNVPFNQMVDLVQRLRAQRVPFEQLVFPDEIHGFLMWKSWMRAYSATADFFDRVLKQGEKIETNH